MSLRKSQIVVKSTANFSTIRAADGDVVRTLGYHASSPGVGAGEYIYRISGKSGVTVDNGFYFAGAASDDYLELIDKSVADVTQFGAVPGSGNPTTLIQAAISTGKTVYLPSGTYTCTASLTTGTSLKMIGDNATIIFNGNYKLNGDALTGEVYISGVKFNGNNNSEQVVNIRGSKVIVSDCEIFNAHGSANTIFGLAIGNITQSLTVSNCRIYNITAIANNVIGDSAGAVRGIAINGTLPWGTIDNCQFNNINNVAVLGGPKVFEDADAIACQPASGVIQQGLITNCSFIDCGKRALKLQLPTGSSWTVDGCNVESTWTRKTVESVDVGANTFTITGHGFANGTRIEMHSSGVLPTPIVTTTTYHVVNTAANTFQLSASSGGPAIDLTSAGSGVITAADTNIMGEVFSCQPRDGSAGSLKISNTTLRGGGAFRFATVFGDGGSLQIDNCESLQEPRFVGGSTAAITSAVLCEDSTMVSINNSTFKGFRIALYILSGDVTVTGSKLYGMSNCVQPSASAMSNLVIDSCELLEDSYLNAASSYHLFIYDQGVDTCLVSNTRFSGMRDAIYKFDDSGDYKIAVSNCIFDGITMCIRNLDLDGAANFTINNCISTDVDLLNPLTISNGDTTPTVLQSGIQRYILQTNNTSPTNIRGLDDAVVGQEYTLILGTNDTLVHASTVDSPDFPFFLRSKQSFTPSASGTILKFIIHDGYAREIANTVVSRKEGQDSLGIASSALVINFDSGNYDNKALVLFNTDCILTLSATRPGIYHIIATQASNGNEFVYPNNVLWVGTPRQPTSQINSVSVIQLYFDGQNFHGA